MRVPTGGETSRLIRAFCWEGEEIRGPAASVVPPRNGPLGLFAGGAGSHPRGTGPRLFPHSATPGKLSLAASEAYENGVVRLSYRPQA